MKTSTIVVTGPDTRWAYVNVWEPKSLGGNKPKYSVRLIIPKSDTRTIQNIQSAIEAAYTEGMAKLVGAGGYLPPFESLSSLPLRDGDVRYPYNRDYLNSYYINTKSNEPPEVFDSEKRLIVKHSEVYSGVYGRASIAFYAFSVGDNQGIVCGLRGLMKIRDGERMGRRRALQDFAEFDEN